MACGWLVGWLAGWLACWPVGFDFFTDWKDLDPDQCHGIAIAMPWHCHGNAMAMPWPCHGVAMAMPWHCQGPSNPEKKTIRPASTPTSRPAGQSEKKNNPTGQHANQPAGQPTNQPHAITLLFPWFQGHRPIQKKKQSKTKTNPFKITPSPV